VYSPLSFRRRPYGEGQLEPDLEHQDAQEEPGQKRQEQDEEEVTEGSAAAGEHLAGAAEWVNRVGP
jgi:hypothetical protein